MVEGPGEGEAMAEVLRISREGEVTILEIDNPPVNATSQAVRRALLDAVKPATPIFFSRVDGHAAWVNGEALKRAVAEMVRPLIERARTMPLAGIAPSSASVRPIVSNRLFALTENWT